MAVPRSFSDRVGGSAPGRQLGALIRRVRVHQWYLGQQRSARHLLDRYGDVVAGGPFTGMRLPIPPEGDLCLAPKLLGRYETELHAVLERLLARPWRTVIDVGCAAGYYTTGLALRCRGAEVYGYDLVESLQGLAAQAAEANGVAGRVHIAGECTHAELQRRCGPETLLVVDIEGAEDELLDPAAVPALAATTMVVEVHDFARAGLSSTLLARFGATHDAEVVYAAGGGDGSAAAEAGAVPRSLRRWVLDEGRPAGMRWLVLQPRVAVDRAGDQAGDRAVDLDVALDADLDVDLDVGRATPASSGAARG